MDYLTLRQQIESVSHRPDLASSIPAYVMLAHADIAKVVESPDQMRATTVSAPMPVAGSIHEYSLPSSCFRVRGVVSNGRRLAMVQPELLFERWQSGQGNPAECAVLGDKLLTGPGTSGELRLIYYQRTPELVDDADTNYVLTNFPAVYLYGAIKHLHFDAQDMEQGMAAEQMYLPALEKARHQVNTMNAGHAPAMVGA